MEKTCAKCAYWDLAAGTGYLVHANSFCILSVENFDLWVEFNGGSKRSFSQLETAGPNPESSSALVFSIGVFGSVQGGVAGHLKIKGLRDSGLESRVGQSDK